MKRVIGPLLATLAGVALLVIGIAGVAGAFDDDSGSGSDDSTEDVADFGSCPTTDERFGEFDSFEVTGDGGRATVILSCQSGSIEVSMVATELSAEKPRTVALWLYNNRKDAELISTALQEPGDNTVVVSGDLPEDSADYKKVVITEEPPEAGFDDPERPTKVILQGRP